jgi:hypothetical protein
MAMVICLLSTCILTAQVADEEFAGPFPSWSNLSRDYGKDSAAFQRGVNDVGTKGHSSVLFFLQEHIAFNNWRS